jgi:hypothetical protein
MGCSRLSTHLGVIITGSRSVRCRSISKLADPEPMTTAARSTAVGTPEASSTSPTRSREAMCVLSSSPAGASPPRYTIRATPAAAAASAKVWAVVSSVPAKPLPVPIECSR